MPSNLELLERRKAAIPRGVSHATTLFATRAENAEIWDADGRRYVDFAGGIAVLNTGHRHPKVIAAVEAQLGLYTHTAFQVMPYEPYVEVCERLNARAPMSGANKTILLTTGAEATENAVKIARAATGRPGVIAFSGAFHGRTMLAMAMTGKVVPYKSQFGPLPSEVYHVPFPVPHQGVSVERALEAIEFLFKADIGPQQVAAIILEPVQGEGGFNIAPPELMRALRALCDRHGIVLIADEVQTGFGRTGKMFAMEHYDVEADLITTAKSLGGGFPISAITGRAAIMDAVDPGGLGGTYAGSPVACAAALAVIDVIDGEDLLARSNAIGARIKARLEAMTRLNDLPPIAAIRGLGGMVAFEIVKERGRYEPDGVRTKAVTTHAAQEGLILLSCGVHGNVIRILVPLTAGDAIVDEGLDKLEQALRLAA